MSKVLVDVNHPAHVHLFRCLLSDLRRAGCQVCVTASEKDLTLDLLKSFDIPFRFVGSYGKSLPMKLVKAPWLNARMLKAVWHEKPDVMVGMASFRAAQVGALLSIPTIILDDTEKRFGLYEPFASRIMTPSSFPKDFGKKHVRYDSFHEFAYLHPNRFAVEPETRSRLGISEERLLFVLRFVSWSASHDVGQQGFTWAEKRRLVQSLSELGTVLISSETPLPPELMQYSGGSIEIDRIHQVLAAADLYIGESATMASESAALGTPAVFVSTSLPAVTRALVEDFGVVKWYSKGSEVAGSIDQILEASLPKTKIEPYHARLLDYAEDTTSVVLKQVQKVSQIGINP